MRVADQSPMAMMNQVGQPRMALSTFVSFPASHAYRVGGPRLLWDTCMHRLMEPNAHEHERAMGFFYRHNPDSVSFRGFTSAIYGSSYGFELSYFDCEPGFG